jgi:hypothetical protein
VTNDFLTRTAARALGQATVVTPLLASTYQSGAGFGLESELTLATPWLAPPRQDTAAPWSSPASTSLPDRRQPRPSAQEPRVAEPQAVETPTADAQPDLDIAETAQVEPPAGDQEPTLSPLRRGQQPARPAPPVRTEASTSPVQTPLTPAEPTLGSLEELRPPTEPVPAAPESALPAEEATPGVPENAFEPPPDAPGLPNPANAGPPPKPTAPPRAGRRGADHIERATGPEAERRREPTLDVAGVGPAPARIVADAMPARADAALLLLPRRSAPTPKRRAEPDVRAAEDSPPVRVTIGRVEIRADSPRPAVPAPPPPSGPTLPLDEYLRTRGGIA